MKRKIIIACSAIAVFIYSFSGDVENAKLRNMSFATLSAEDKTLYKSELVKDLKDDSLFSAYDRVANFQLDLFLEGRAVANGKIPTDAPLSLKSGKELANYYKKLGVSKPDMYAQLEIVKYSLLARLHKKYPELSLMDEVSRAEVFNSSKEPVKISRRLKRMALAGKILKRNK